MLEHHVRTLLVEAGARPSDAAETARALLHASRIGVDSHGVRLAGYYADLLRSGGLNPTPAPLYTRTAIATGRLDADSGLAHPACYRAMSEAMLLAREAGIGAVGVHRSTHFGAAGAYAVEAAREGMIGLVVSNSDSAVSLFSGTAPFHGTNPIAAAAPVRDADPWLLDMATSSIPFNRVKLYQALGIGLPAGVALDEHGAPTLDPQRASFLQPLGGEAFGFKGAALAGLVTLLSAVMTGADTDPVMVGTDAGQTADNRQNVGHFVIAIDPERFVGRDSYDTAMARYLSLLRNGPSLDSAHPVMAPGDREWQEARHRMETGIPVDPETRTKLDLP
jgi:LDH2 family malate/lactate/ureidoglycolate dehydrogenase